MSYLTQELNISDGVKDFLKYTVKSVHMKNGAHLYEGKRICELIGEDKISFNVKSKYGGVVFKTNIKVGDNISVGDTLMEVKACLHPTILSNLCCDCGTALEERTVQSEENRSQELVSMLHSIPELKVSKEEAARVGSEDIKHLLDKRKLVLLVDLDQTLIHTTNDDIPPKLKDVFHFQLAPNGHWYHTRLRPYTNTFLRNISKFYELHICTFGVREYAHSIAKFLDPDRKLFGDRILSRNECLDPMSKKGNLSSLFPCGDNLVCIIDDRSDVWNFAPNVVQVMPYHFFQHTGDINAPPGLQKKEKDDDINIGFDFSKIEELTSVKDGGKKGKKTKFSEEENIENETSTGETSDKSEEELEKINSKEEESEKRNTEDMERINDIGDKSEKKSVEDSVEKSDIKEKSENKNIEELTDESDIKEAFEKSDIDDTAEKSEMKDESETICCEETSEKRNSMEDACENSEEKTGDLSDVGETLVKEEASITDPTEILPEETKTESDKNEATTKIDVNESDEEDLVPDKNTDSETVDVEDNDDYLLYLEDILKKLHKEFYDNYHIGSYNEDVLPDLKMIVPTIRKTVLDGCYLVLSGIVPQNTNLTDSKAYHIATSLGAIVTDKVIVTNDKSVTSNVTTHVIAANLHTEKVHQAKRQKHIKIVTPNWLWCCAERWERVDERLFKLTPESEKIITRSPPMHCFINLNKSAAPIDSGSPFKSVSRKVTPQKTDYRDKNLFETLNPLAYLSNDEAKSMEEEVDDILDLDDDDDDEEKKDGKEVKESSSESEDNSRIDQIINDEDEDDDDDDDEAAKRKRKRKRSFEDDYNDDDEDEEEELPSIRFRQGGSLPSDENDGDSGDEDMNAYGDILEQELMRE